MLSARRPLHMVATSARDGCSLLAGGLLCTLLGTKYSIAQPLELRATGLAGGVSGKLAARQVLL